MVLDREPPDGRGGGGARRFGFQLTFFRTALAPTAAAPPLRLGRPRRVHGPPGADGRRCRPVPRPGSLGAGRARSGRRDGRTRSACGSATGSPRARRRTGCRFVSGQGRGTSGSTSRSRTAKPAVLHGERGLSRKSAEPGNASYYYSLTRMPASGEVRVDGRAFAVEGHGVDGPRVEHERARAGSGRLGLVRAPARRRARADALPPPAARRGRGGREPGDPGRRRRHDARRSPGTRVEVLVLAHWRARGPARDIRRAGGFACLRRRSTCR